MEEDITTTEQVKLKIAGRNEKNRVLYTYDTINYLLSTYTGESNIPFPSLHQVLIISQCNTLLYSALNYNIYHGVLQPHWFHDTFSLTPSPRQYWSLGTPSTTIAWLSPHSSIAKIFDDVFMFSFFLPGYFSTHDIHYFPRRSRLRGLKSGERYVMIYIILYRFTHHFVWRTYLHPF